VIVIIIGFLTVEANLAVIFHKRVQICPYLNNPISITIYAINITSLVFKCLSYQRNYITFVIAARINRLLG